MTEVADERNFAPKVEFEPEDVGDAAAGEAGEAAAAAGEAAAGDAAAADDAAPAKGSKEDFKAFAGGVSAWVSQNFPGHERAFWGGVAGLVVALLIMAIGPLNTLLIVALVVVGVAVGQFFDGKPTIIDAIKKLISGGQQ